jgi:hypothetical protein
MIYYGDFKTGQTVILTLNTFDSDGASCTVTNLAATDVHVHKDGGTTQRASASGIAVTIDYDSIIGNHLITIDLSDNTTADFWQAGHDYSVRVEGITVDGNTINAFIGSFSIENRSALMPTTIGNRLDVSATGEAGIDLSNIKQATGATTLTNITVPVVTLVDTCTTNTDMRGTNSAALASSLVTAQNDLTAIKGATFDTATDSLEAIRNVTALASATSTIISNQSAQATAANQTTIINNQTAMKGATFDTSTDSLEAIRNRGDAAWTSSAGSGASTATITVNDGTNPIADCSVQIWNSALTLMVTYATSNVSGQVALNVDDGTYKVKLRKAGYSFSTENLTVSGATAATFSGTSATIPGTEDATLCRVYEYIREADGDFPATCAGYMKIISLPYDFNTSIYSGAAITGVYNSATGLIYWDIPRGATVQASIIGYGYNYENSYIVPAEASKRLSLLEVE